MLTCLDTTNTSSMLNRRETFRKSWETRECSCWMPAVRSAIRSSWSWTCLTRPYLTLLCIVELGWTMCEVWCCLMPIAWSTANWLKLDKVNADSAPFSLNNEHVKSSLAVVSSCCRWTWWSSEVAWHTPFWRSRTPKFLPLQQEVLWQWLMKVLYPR